MGQSSNQFGMYIQTDRIIGIFSFSKYYRVSTEVSLPPRDEIIQFDNSVSGFFEKMLLNKLQIRNLEKLRDTLLPKLMSGEVRVEL
jgi:hypothetical protein